MIVKEWDNILRIMATLGLKKSSQSAIVKKLSSYQSNDTLRALIELDKIIMSLYMLDYIDDEGMRKTVHRSLNRGESYHQLRSAIARISSRKLAGKTLAITSILLAFIINGSFDVFFEGPMGAFPFWTFVGLLFLENTYGNPIEIPN